MLLRCHGLPALTEPRLGSWVRRLSTTAVAGVGAEFSSPDVRSAGGRDADDVTGLPICMPIRRAPQGQIGVSIAIGDLRGGVAISAQLTSVMSVRAKCDVQIVARFARSVLKPCHSICHSTGQYWPTRGDTRQHDDYDYPCSDHTKRHQTTRAGQSLSPSQSGDGHGPYSASSRLLGGRSAAQRPQPVEGYESVRGFPHGKTAAAVCRDRGLSGRSAGMLMMAGCLTGMLTRPPDRRRRADGGCARVVSKVVTLSSTISSRSHRQGRLPWACRREQVRGGSDGHTESGGGEVGG